MKAFKKRYLVYGLAAILAFLIGLYFFVRTHHKVEILQTHYPHVHYTKEKSVVVTFEAKKPSYWVNLKQISTFAKWAIVLSEDWAFYQHDGVDVEQLKIALDDMWDGRRFRGASTISQQMIKNIFLTEERTVWRKLNEYILTKDAEDILSKDKILEIYLNSIEFGPGIYGIRAAARHYFRKHPSEITPREGAFLAMLLPSPVKYYVSYRRKKLSKFALKRIASILEKLRMAKIITRERFEEEKASRFAWESE